MTSVSAGHIILTLIQPVRSGRPQQESNPGPLHQESCALPTELPLPTPPHSQLTTNLVLIAPNFLTPEKIPSDVLWGQKVLYLNIQAKVAGLCSTKSRHTLTILFSTSLLYSNKGEEPRCAHRCILGKTTISKPMKQKNFKEN